MDEDDLKWVGNEKNVLLSLKQFHEHVRSKPLVLKKLSHFSEMQNDALMHREGFKTYSQKFYKFYSHTPHDK